MSYKSWFKHIHKYVYTVAEFYQLWYLNSLNDMHAANRTIRMELLFISERSNNILSTDIFSYFIVNTVTIVSNLLLQKGYTAFEYHASVFYCLSWKIIGSQIC